MASVLPVREQATSQRTTGEQTRSLKYRGRHDDPGPAKERKPPGEGPRAAPQRRHIVDQTRPPGFTLGSLGRPPRPRLRPAYGTHHRIVAQPGHSACSGCKRSPVRIRPVRPIFEPFDLGYCESSRSSTRRTTVRSPLAQSLRSVAQAEAPGGADPHRFPLLVRQRTARRLVIRAWYGIPPCAGIESRRCDHFGEAPLLLPLSSRTSSVIQPPTRMKNAGRCAQAWRSGQPVHRQYPDGKPSLDPPGPRLDPFLSS